MRVFTAIEDYNPNKKDVKVFLAGGISNCPDWQSKVIDFLSNAKEDTNNLMIFNPRVKDYKVDSKEKEYATKQIEWEFKYLENCDIFSMYFCGGESDQPICMYELGRNILRMQTRFPTDWSERIIISANDNYRRYYDVLKQVSLAARAEIGIWSNVDDDRLIEMHAKAILDAYEFFNYVSR